MGASEVSRRHFLMGAAATAATAGLVHRRARASTSPDEKLNIACIGAGGRGESDLNGCKDENIVALCDVDDARAARSFEKYPDAKRYKDFRVMLEQQKDIDAVIIATPDHMHAIAAMAAMNLGKHVYCEKPLTHTIREARLLTETAREKGLVTQMGIQGHSMEGIRQIAEWVRDGAIGTVREVHIWTDRPAGWWPQGVERPTEEVPVPDTLDWDLWLGPAPYRPYNPIYCPFTWRGRWDFGCGALGDMACHLFDAPFYALDLGYPESVEAQSTPVNDESAPLAEMIKYTFGAKGDRAPVTVTWYDGGMKPFVPAALDDGKRIGNKNGGLLMIGDDGAITAQDENAQHPRLLPESRALDYKQPEPTIPRSIGHHAEWIAACKGEGKADANFDYSGPLTELVLLGNLAVRTGEKILWDGPNMTCTNLPEANKLVTKEYREGWAI